MFRRSLLVVVMVAGLISPMSAAADEPVVREVLAGARAPGGTTGPFVFTAYYPEDVQVHRGDLVRWTFPGSYQWHSVSFGDLPKRIARNDEYPGHLAFDEPWLFGPELGDQSKQCGRGNWFWLADQDPCQLNEVTIAGGASSSIFDRFFSLPYTGTFTAQVDLEPGTYPYFCKIHPQMTGTLQVVPDDVEVSNPDREELDRQILADQREAEELRVSLADPADAWDPVAEEWVVNVGASTGRVDIHDFLPGTLPVAPGERVRFQAATHDPSSVAFPSDAQGGFSAGGSCGPDGCPTGTGAPWGMTGLAFPWACDPDDREGGLPGVLFSYVVSGVARAAQGAGARPGCAAGTNPELLFSPYISAPTRAPGDMVVPGAVHISGMVLPDHTPDWFARKPDGTRFPTQFEANFPVEGTFAYACLNHEFMKGSIQVG